MRDLDLTYSSSHIMSSGETSQRKELLITKSGPRFTHPGGFHIMTTGPVLIVVVEMTETMLPSFCNDLVQG